MKQSGKTQKPRTMFRDRQTAGKELALKLRRYATENTVVLALPRGGIEVAAAVARELKAPLGLVLVRKIGHPCYPEYAIGAIAEDEPPVYDAPELGAIDKSWLEASEESARELIRFRRDAYYGDGFTPPAIDGKTAIIIDDGLATGLTMQAAVYAVKKRRPAHTIVAVPVASAESLAMLQPLADEVTVLVEPAYFAGAVGAHYAHFPQVNDEEVSKLLREVNHAIRKTATAST